MCNISKGCMCSSLGLFIRNNKETGLNMRDFFHRNQQDEAYKFLKEAIKIDAKSGRKSVIADCIKLADSSLLIKVETGNGGFIYQFRSDGFCPNEDVRRSFSNFLIGTNGKLKTGELNYQDIGELKNRLQDVVEQVQHRVFPILMADKSFAQVMETLKTTHNPTQYHKDILKNFKEKQITEVINNVMEELNMDNAGDVGDNSKTGVSIPH